MAKRAVIGLLMATHLEAKPFLEGIAYERIADSPFPVYKSDETVLVVSGMAKANAAMACACLALTHAPACIVNMGAAGAAGGGHPLGAIYHVSEAVEYDRRHFRTGLPFRHRPNILEGFATARLATQDRPVIDPEKRREIAPMAELLDMEGAAVIQAAQKFHIPCYLFKFVSDTPAHTTDRDIPVHIRLYRSAMFDFFMSAVLPILNDPRALHASIGRPENL